MTSSDNDKAMSSTEASESDKYARMWAVKGYRRYSPGEVAAPDAFTALDMKPGERLLDLGCGTGRGGMYFFEQGLDVDLVDFCPAAPEVELPFTDACLWGEIPVEPGDWVYCCDVLEHIPRERVDAVLANIARLMQRGGYLQIHCAPDGFGAVIGEKLHVTVEAPLWWHERVAAHFRIVLEKTLDTTATFVIAPKAG
jgi:SAM-dependent methyltransferase